MDFRIPKNISEDHIQKQSKQLKILYLDKISDGYAKFRFKPRIYTIKAGEILEAFATDILKLYELFDLVLSNANTPAYYRKQPWIGYSKEKIYRDDVHKAFHTNVTEYFLSYELRDILLKNRVVVGVIEYNLKTDETRDYTKEVIIRVDIP